MQQWLVIGANSALAQAVLSRLKAAGYDYRGLSRNPPDDPKLARWQADEASLQAACAQWQAEGYQPTHVLICLGQLHNAELQPEKRLEDLHASALESLLYSNAALPALCLKHLLLLLKRSAARVAICSARVGSIGDNRLGGWYAYRASKAALNMLVQTAAVEYARRAPNVRLMLFHPGTMDSPLSKPFQANVPAGKLFSAEFVADCLAQRYNELAQHEAGQAWFVDWQGQTVPW